VRHLLVGVIVTVLHALTSPAAEACECAGPGTSCVAVTSADAVFVGRVLSAEPMATVRFAVEQIITGPPGPEVAIENSGGMCAVDFTIGDRYVVYAYSDRSTGRLTTNRCMRTRPLSDPRTRADLAYFGLMSRPGSAGALLTGVVTDVTPNLAARARFHRPLDGIEITLAPNGGGKPLSTKTREDGTFELTGVPVGTFRFVAALPPPFEASPPRTVTIGAADRCTEADVATRVDGRIRGRLLDENGPCSRHSGPPCGPHPRG
jgi:hypothetical protein